MTKTIPFPALTIPLPHIFPLMAPSIAEAHSKMLNDAKPFLVKGTATANLPNKTHRNPRD